MRKPQAKGKGEKGKDPVQTEAIKHKSQQNQKMGANGKRGWETQRGGKNQHIIKQHKTTKGQRKQTLLLLLLLLSLPWFTWGISIRYLT